MDMLVRTPQPYQNESMWGFALRVTEANGYLAPSRMLANSLAGGVSGTNINISVDVLSKMVGSDGAALRRIANYHDGSKDIFMLGQRISSRNTVNPLRLRNPAFCPHCVKEDGHIDAVWDISFMVACPKHECELTNHCQSCGETLNYQRPGILTCRCGADLADTQVKPASQQLIEFAAVISAKVHGQSVEGLPNTSKLPLQHFEPMSLIAFFDMLECLARHALRSRRGVANKGDLEVTTKLAELFGNWPHSYHGFLKSIDNTYGSKNQNSVRLGARFREFFTSMFVKGQNAKEYGFLQDEYVRYGCDGLGECTVSEKTAKLLGLQRRLVSQAELCRMWNITPPTLKRIIHDNNIPVKIVGQQYKPSYIIDISAYDVSMNVEPECTDRKTAAEMMGIPVTILPKLRMKGTYQVANPANRRGGYFLTDIERFRKSILDKAKLVDGERPPANMTISLRDVLFTYKFGSVEEKCRFISRYLDGEIKAVGRYGDTANDILFNQQMVRDLSRLARIFRVDGDCSAMDAAQFLVSDERIVSTLAKNGSLATVRNPSYGLIRIKKESLQEFSINWCSIKSIAQDFQISSRRIQRLANENKIFRLIVDAAGSSYQSSFVERVHEAQLRSVVEADVKTFGLKGRKGLHGD